MARRRERLTEEQQQLVNHFGELIAASSREIDNSEELIGSFQACLFNVGANFGNRLQVRPEAHLWALYHLAAKQTRQSNMLFEYLLTGAEYIQTEIVNGELLERILGSNSELFPLLETHAKNHGYDEDFNHRYEMILRQKYSTEEKAESKQQGDLQRGFQSDSEDQNYESRQSGFDKSGVPQNQAPKGKKSPWVNFRNDLTKKTGIDEAWKRTGEENVNRFRNFERGFRNELRELNPFVSNKLKEFANSLDHSNQDTTRTNDQNEEINISEQSRIITTAYRESNKAHTKFPVPGLSVREVEDWLTQHRIKVKVIKWNEKTCIVFPDPKARETLEQQMKEVENGTRLPTSRPTTQTQPAKNPVDDRQNEMARRLEVMQQELNALRREKTDQSQPPPPRSKFESQENQLDPDDEDLQKALEESLNFNRTNNEPTSKEFQQSHSSREMKRKNQGEENELSEKITTSYERSLKTDNDVFSVNANAEGVKNWLEQNGFSGASVIEGETRNTSVVMLPDSHRERRAFDNKMREKTSELSAQTLGK